ncbi:MAG: class I tRNA ligase family protein, partial [Thermoanaerobaculia bacterium]
LTDRTIPVIADEFVDQAFGTGVVKVTPAHDPNDFETGRRHELESIEVIGFDGCMTEAAGAAFAGLDRFDARKKVLKELDALGLRRGEKSHVMSLGRCQRCETVLEPLVSLQWFVKIKPLADVAIAAADRGDVRFTPDSWKKTYDEWMKNIRDWCVSRQLWWGHPIPAWTCHENHVTVPKPGEGDPIHCVTCNAGDLVRDPDVFDTWFSSWLMPLSVLGWPEKTPDLARFYPTSVLVTGFDILFFWVARMVMAGCWFDEQVPFADVFLHGLVRVDGQKMSKTKGNVIDPLVACDEFGADAVRFTLAVASGTGRDPSVGNARFEGSRAFATKVWNAARFAIGMMGDDPADGPVEFSVLGTVDRWILTRLSATAARVNEALEAFRFDEASNALYAFFWTEFCDGYLEMIKPLLRDENLPDEDKRKTRAVLKRVLLDSVSLLHPFMPFVTCEVREALNHDGLTLPKAPFPVARPDWNDPLAVATIEVVRAATTRIRNLRAERGLPQTQTLRAALEVPAGPLANLLARHHGLISAMARLESLEIAPAVEIPGAFRDAVGSVGLVVVLPEKTLSEAERGRLEKDLQALQREADALRFKLSNVAFLSRAPADVVEKNRKLLAELDERRVRLSGNLESTPG